jgi:hypothetical protein
MLLFSNILLGLGLSFSDGSFIDVSSMNHNFAYTHELGVYKKERYSVDSLRAGYTLLKGKQYTIVAGSFVGVETHYASTIFNASYVTASPYLLVRAKFKHFCYDGGKKDPSCIVSRVVSWIDYGKFYNTIGASRGAATGGYKNEPVAYLGIQGLIK